MKDIFKKIQDVAVDMSIDEKDLPEEISKAVANDLWECGSLLNMQSPTRLSVRVDNAVELAVEKGNKKFIEILQRDWETNVTRICFRHWGYAFALAVMKGDVGIAELLYQDHLYKSIYINQSAVTSGKLPAQLVDLKNTAMVAFLHKCQNELDKLLEDPYPRLRADFLALSPKASVK